MATYADLIKKLEAGKVHRLTWICGDQPVLREEAVTAIRLTLAPAEMNSVTLFAQNKSHNAHVWTEIAQAALDSTEVRLVVVRDAEKLNPVDKLADWLNGAHFSKVHVVMMSNLSDWSQDYASETRKRVVGSASSLYVEARLSRTPGGKEDPRDEHGRPYSKGEQQVARIVAEFWTPHLSVAEGLKLARRSGCDLSRVRDVCAWINTLKKANPEWKITQRTIETLAMPSAVEGFADALTRLDKAGAMRLAGEMDGDQRRPALTRLQKNLMSLEAVNRAMKPVLQRYAGDRSKIPYAIRETAKAAHVSDYEVGRLWDSAKYYDPASVSRRVEALILADRNRNEVGVLEMLVAQW